MRIWANCIVKDEENFVYFALKSVINFVEKILVYDTGSLDNTTKIIDTLKKDYPKKIEFIKTGKVSRLGYTKIRQKMLDKSDCDWVLILDGDEIWFKNSIKKLLNEARQSKNVDAFVVPFYNSVGDIYHYQDESAGKYNLLGKIGHQSIKLISKKIPGLHWDLPFPYEGLFNKDNILIQNASRLKFINTPFLHTSLLNRSRFKKVNKKKLEIGKKFPKDFKYPEVFYLSQSNRWAEEPYPEYVKSPFKNISGFDLILAKLLTPLKKIKRRIR